MSLMRIREEILRLQTTLQMLDGCSLVSFTHDLEESVVRLEIRHWDGHVISVVCRGVIYCNISRMELESDNEVIRATVQEFSSDILGELQKTGYLWSLSSEAERSLDGPWLEFSLNGETSVEIFCKELML